MAWFTDPNSLKWNCSILFIYEQNQAGYPWCMTGPRRHIFTVWIMCFSEAEHFHTVMLTNPCCRCAATFICVNNIGLVGSDHTGHSLIHFVVLFYSVKLCFNWFSSAWCAHHIKHAHTWPAFSVDQFDLPPFEHRFVSVFASIHPFLIFIYCKSELHTSWNLPIMQFNTQHILVTVV